MLPTSSSVTPRVIAVLGFLAAAAYFALPRAGKLTASSIPTVTLSNGLQMPIISAGLWEARKLVSNVASRSPMPNLHAQPGASACIPLLSQVEPDEATAMIPKAFDVGFNHIDASCVVYRNEAEVGNALSKYDRGGYFLTTKLDPLPTWSPTELVQKTTAQLEECLRSHQVESIDLLLVHWPLADCKTNQKVWGAVEAFYKAGKAKSSECPPRPLRAAASLIDLCAPQPLTKSARFCMLRVVSIPLLSQSASATSAALSSTASWRRRRCLQRSIRCYTTVRALTAAVARSGAAAHPRSRCLQAS